MSASKNLEYKKTSFLNKSNNAFIEQMYVKFINKDPSLPKGWKEYFLDISEDLDSVVREIKGPSWSPKEIKIKENIEFKKEDSTLKVNQTDVIAGNSNSIRAVSLIRSYRQRGHLLSKLDPLEIRESEYLDELHPENYGFSKEDYDKQIYLDGILNKEYSNIREILSILRKTYCGSVGYEYMHISNPTERKWFRDRVEKDENALKFTENGKSAILNKLIQAEGFEKFLHTKYVGSKRFGLDGGESLIPGLE